MGELKDVLHDDGIRAALDELTGELRKQFDIHRVVLFGSYARGDWDEESDVDLLVITGSKLSRRERHKITDIVFKVNLEHDTNFSSLVVDRHSWEQGFYPLLTLHEDVEKDGVAV